MMVTVHVGGKRFKNVPAVKAEGRYYTYSNGRWWQLSHQSDTILHGRTGWRSFNVGMPNDFDPGKLSREAK